jgi:(1->4)-alpha-D-glucan 1-alpha-D-glucosylmutase
MSTPRATYRLQFRNGMTFARAEALAPYFARLGISHLYASPIFAAVPESTHGYDAIDMNLIEPSLGGEAGFRAMAETLRRHGIGIVVDFVPNHMGASPLNSWWRDVLEWGAAASRAPHFDVDWSAPKLIVPALADPYGVALERGAFGLAFDRTVGTFSFTSNGLVLPLTPPSYAHILARIEGDAFAELARRFAVAAPETAQDLKAELSTAAEKNFATLQHVIEDTSRDSAALHALHELQVWRLAHWRAARETLTYRRFFEIADLVGVSVERPHVFDDVHAKVLELVRDGAVGGLRLDHIDGLADPRQYLQRLASEIRPDTYLVVEKILGPGEALRRDWPVAGTTGYEFIGALSWALVDWTALPRLTDGYRDFVGSKASFSQLSTGSKRRILSRNFAGELERLKETALTLAGRDLKTRDLGSDTLRRAIIELITALDVYRTYVDIAGPSPEDRIILARAAAAAKLTREIEDDDVIDFLVRILTLDFAAPEDQATAFEFATRFQQTTGPIVAKAIEDTAFYRFNPMIGLNEVGSHLDEGERTPRDFHAAMEERRTTQRAGLSTTSTHDTKRGEDARARLYALSEMPDAWVEAAVSWSAVVRDGSGDEEGATAIDRESEWLFYQTLAAAWPTDLLPSDAGGLAVLSQRIAEFMRKAVREAKMHTSWTAPDASYEGAVHQFVASALEPSHSAKFLNDFHASCQPLFVAGALNSFAQTLIKVTAPGVPDIYQGSELWDLSLVDPDNRRAVDFETRKKYLEPNNGRGLRGLIADWRSGAIKLWLLHTALKFRAEHAALFETGGYVPLRTVGPVADNVLAFARLDATEGAVTITPRLCLRLVEGEKQPLVPPERWHETEILLPPQLAGRGLRDVLTGAEFEARQKVPLREILNAFPVSLLATL